MPHSSARQATQSWLAKACCTVHLFTVATLQVQSSKFESSKSWKISCKLLLSHYFSP